MRGSLRLFSFAGIPVFIHWTFLILLAWVFGATMYRGAGLREGLLSMLYVLALFGCVVLHEFGHALAARRYGIRTRDITLLPIGGVARLERMPDKPAQEIVVAIAGPMVNVAIALVLLAIVGFPRLTGPAPEQVLTPGPESFLTSLMIVNVFLVLFNLIPAFPMDGGRILRAILAFFMEYHIATRVAAGVGQICAMGFALAGLFGNPFLILIGVFVWLGAQAEAQAAESRMYFSGVTAQEAMVTDFQVLDENETLDDALKALLRGTQPDFPIVSDGEFVGVLPRSDLLRAIAAHGPGAPIAQAVRRDCSVARENEPLENVIARMHETGCPLVPVMRNGHVIGIITGDNISELLAIRSTLGPGWRRSGPPQRVVVTTQGAPRFPSV